MTPDVRIDCERHMIVETLDDLAPYISDGWLARLRMGEFAMPRSGPHPGAELSSPAGRAVLTRSAPPPSWATAPRTRY